MRQVYVCKQKLKLYVVSTQIEVPKKYRFYSNQKLTQQRLISVLQTQCINSQWVSYIYVKDVIARVSITYLCFLCQQRCRWCQHQGGLRPPPLLPPPPPPPPLHCYPRETANNRKMINIIGEYKNHWIMR